MSTAFFKSSVKPELVHSILRQSGHRSVEIWTTTCIVTNFRTANCTALINPANPQLSGVKKFTYFPRGGPVPDTVTTMHKDWQPLGHVSAWGGMEVGSGMCYPVSVIDGLVHQLGGWKFDAECRFKQMVAINSDACPLGEAVTTSAGDGKLKEEYDLIVHTAPPFYNFHETPEELLFRCYKNAFGVGIDKQHQRIATALIGAGCRGFPETAAVDVAGTATAQWLEQQGKKGTIVFGLLEPKHAEDLVESIDEKLSI